MINGIKKIYLKDLIEVHSGDSIASSQLFKFGKYPVFGANGINGFTNNYNTLKDHLIIGRVGEKCGNVKFSDFNFWATDNALVVSPKKKYDNNYMLQLLNYINLNNYANKNAQPVISGKIINDIKITYLDNIKEQQTISEILSNVDNLVKSLEQTIAKKEKIYKTSIQELLNGKKRLPNFQAKWKKYKIGDIGIFSGNGVDKKIYKNEVSIRLLNYMDIMNNNFIYKNISKHYVTSSLEKIKRCYVKKGDIFLTPSSETRSDIGISAVAMEDIEDLVYSYHIIRFRPKIEMDLLFRAYIFKNDKFLKQASIFSEGSGKRYVCSNKKFALFELEIPTDIKEQRAIANVLYNMEEQINILKDKLTKYTKLKEGMMDDLLTGKVRVNYE